MSKWIGLSNGGLSAAPRHARSARSVVIIGDSTVYPGTVGPFGWGSRLESVFPTSSITVTNKAISGASTKSFWDTYWAAASGSIEFRSTVLIQFGHNDAHHTTPAQYTTTGTAPAWDGTYRDYLELMINAAKDVGAQVILISSVSHLSFTSTSAQGEVIDERLAPPGVGDGVSNYPAAILAIASSNGLESIDLHTLSKTLFQRLGQTVTHELYANNASTDLTHFSLEGSRGIAELVRREIAAGASSLAAYASVAPCIITSDVAGRIWVGGTYVLTGSVTASGMAVTLYWVSPTASSATLIGSAVVTGQVWTYSWTPTVALGIGWLEARCAKGNSGRVPIDVRAVPSAATCVAFWDADYGITLSGSDVSSWDSVVGGETWTAVTAPEYSYLRPDVVTTRRAPDWDAANNEYMVSASTALRDLMRNSDTASVSVVWRGRLTTSGTIISWGDASGTSIYAYANAATNLTLSVRGTSDAVGVSGISGFARDGSVIHTWGFTWTRGATNEVVWYQDGAADSPRACVCDDLSDIDYITLGILARGANRGTRGSPYDGTIRQLWLGTGLDADAHAAAHTAFLYM